MSIVINEFEIVTEPPPETAGREEPQSEQTNAEETLRLRPGDVVRVMDLQRARLERVRAS